MGRAPLPGWKLENYGFMIFEAGPWGLAAHPCGVWRAKAPIYLGMDDASSLVGAQLLAEDAARSLVDEMAAALGGRVVWADAQEGVGE